MESKGSGFDIIENDYRGKGDKWIPYISSDSSSFTLVLPDLSYSTGVIDENNIPKVYFDGISGGSVHDKSILSFCYPSPHSAIETAAYIDVNPSTYFRKTILSHLVDNGLLIEDRTSNPILYRSSPNKVHAI